MRAIETDRADRLVPAHRTVWLAISPACVLEAERAAVAIVAVTALSGNDLGEHRRILARASLGHTYPMGIVLRPALASDASFLVDMLVAAAFWRPDRPSGSRDDVLNTPELAHYASGWPKPGDLGFVAENDQPVGAAWLRFFPVHDPGFGFLSADIPEVGMGVVRQVRSKGFGRRLLQTLIEAARGAGIPALSLDPPIGV